MKRNYEDTNIMLMKTNMEINLKEIITDANWLDKYNSWCSNEKNDFDSLLIINDPFNQKNVGERQFFDPSDKISIADLDILKMSVFISEEILNYKRQTVDSIKNEKNKSKKINIIKEYFDFIDRCYKYTCISNCIITLNAFSEKQIVLFSKQPRDLYKCFFSLRETLRKSSIESIYLLFTIWRITHNETYLNNLILSIIDYIRTYFEDYNNDPEMKLYAELGNQSTINQLITIGKWLDIISIHTNEIFKKYKTLNWLYPTDKLMDDFTITNIISKFDLYKYSFIFKNDSKDIVINKAICNQGYGIWIKTADIMTIVCEIFKTLNINKNNILNKLSISKKSILVYYNNMLEIKDFYLKSIFSHRAYYQNKREYLDSNITELLELDQELFNESINDFIKITNALINDDINDLLLAKREYVNHFDRYISQEQQDTFEEYIKLAIRKIKAKIQKLDIYEELFNSISSQLLPYTFELLNYPQLFSSLVSAEYLYKQYIENSISSKMLDYSFISIMYYMSLEDFVNKLIYTPYSNEVLINIDKGNWENYVSSYSAFWDNKLRTYKKSCEIGNLGYLIKNLDQESYFKSFILLKYPNIDLEKFKLFGEKLINIAPRRNDAAHGGNVISYEIAKQDKQYVYNNNEINYKGLIIEFMNILFNVTI